MSSLHLFDNIEIRFVEHSGGKYKFGIVAADIAKLLDLDPRQTNKMPVDEEWKGMQSIPTNGGNQVVNVIWEPGIKQLLQKSRKPNARLVAEHLNIDLDICRAPIESNTIRIIKSAFQHLNPIDQFFVSGYRIDLYFPSHRIAVECDEKHHGRTQKEDMKRQDTITKILGCTWIRYSPSENGFCVGGVINTLLKKIYP